MLIICDTWMQFAFYVNRIRVSDVYYGAVYTRYRTQCERKNCEWWMEDHHWFMWTTL